MDFLQYITNLPYFSIQYIENISMVAALLFLYFLIKQKRIAWFFTIISSFGLTYIYFYENVYMQSILYFCYGIMGIYGFIKWSQKDKITPNIRSLKISEYSVRTHLIFIFITILLSGSIATFMHLFVDSAYTTLDSILFAFSILATYLQANKIVSNWIYWIIIDGLYMILNFCLSLYLLSILMFLYILFAIWGYKKWKKELSHQKT